MYRRNEALVVEINGALYIADSYQKEKYALRDYEFKNVLIDDYTLSDTFYMSDVFFFELNSKDVKRYIDNMNASYSKLMSCAFKAYQKSRGSRGILNISAMAQQAQNFDEIFAALMSEHFANFFKRIMQCFHCSMVILIRILAKIAKHIQQKTQEISRLWRMIHLNSLRGLFHFHQALRKVMYKTQAKRWMSF